MKVDTDKIQWLLDNFSQVEIAAETGVSQPTLSKIIRGDRKIENLRIGTGHLLTKCAKKFKKVEEKR